MKQLSVLMMIALMFVLAACGNQQGKKEETKTASEEEVVEIKNNFTLRGKAQDGSEDKAYQDTVKVTKNPKKAIVFDYGTVDTLKALGVEDQIAALPKGEGNASLPDFLSEFKDARYTNLGSLKDINFDAVAKVKPDIIYLSPRTATQKNIDELKKAAPDASIVYMSANDKDFIASMKLNTQKLGEIYNKTSEAEALVKTLDEKIAKMKAHTKNIHDKAMYLLVNEGELSTFGAGDRFGNLVYNTLGFTPADDQIKGSRHGQNVTNEYVSEKNPGIIFAMDRGQAIGKRSTAKQVLGNDVLKNVSAIKKGQVVELDPKLWYFSSGSTTTTIKQIDELEKGLELK
ncbi:ferrated catecholamine ABC transporter substrate-binding lipoprotein SstD [Staphylococcus lutrae]|uniref:Iron ABC transporter substrate-binding protein n=1 Tax=Staphylococcus lutrae TaxID=155085 RepID=A0AAC9RS28_9STAP|nr:ABC transporter substrate-binding protein [Staphylococcus lutrae]ARJ50629.1 iron ABC transporter substrate-binding protein [Staphylococcus lutrae]PNZ38816.1 iron ABC transporter substrate-binding protein [Staphylococcus lutrae]